MRVCVSVSECVSVCVCVCAYVCLCVSVCVCVNVYVCLCVSVCACMFMCMSVQICDCDDCEGLMCSWCTFKGKRPCVPHSDQHTYSVTGNWLLGPPVAAISPETYLKPWVKHTNKHVSDVDTYKVQAKSHKKRNLAVKSKQNLCKFKIGAISHITSR